MSAMIAGKARAHYAVRGRPNICPAIAAAEAANHYLAVLPDPRGRASFWTV